MTFYVVLADNFTHRFKTLEYITNSSALSKDNLNELVTRAKDDLGMKKPVVVFWSELSGDPTRRPYGEHILQYLRKVHDYIDNSHDEDLQSLSTSEVIDLICQPTNTDLGMTEFKSLIRELYAY